MIPVPSRLCHSSDSTQPANIGKGKGLVALVEADMQFFGPFLILTSTAA